jgi:predicted dinucleotide-binding enzyme
MEFGARCQTLKLSTPADVGNLSTSQLVAALAPGARVVKAFNHMTVPNLEADPVVNGARRVALVSADDDAVKSYSKSLPTPSLILETFAMEV